MSDTTTGVIVIMASNITPKIIEHCIDDNLPLRVLDTNNRDDKVDIEFPVSVLVQELERSTAFANHHSGMKRHEDGSLSFGFLAKTPMDNVAIMISRICDDIINSGECFATYDDDIKYQITSFHEERMIQLKSFTK